MTDAKATVAEFRTSLAGDSNTQHNSSEPPARPQRKQCHRVQINDADINQQLELQKEDNSNDSSPCPSAHESKTDRTIISFKHDDPGNPHHWPQWKKAWVVCAGIVMVLNSTLGSSIPAGATQEISVAFHNTNEEQLVLPTAIYLGGYALGPLAFGPLSESYGRKIIMISTFVIFTIFTMACALSPNFAVLVVFRFITGVGASTPVSVIGGIYADVYNDPTSRGRAMTLFMCATTFGPLLGPIISGFIAPVDWRWSFWIALILAGFTWPMLLTMPETYGPIILKSRARKMRKETGDANIFAPIELEKKGMKQLLVVVLTRPVRMFLFEAIVLSSCLYLSFAYGIFYMYFQAYPIIFEGIYGFNAGEEGLTFLPIGVGACFACAVYLWWDRLLANAKARSSPPAWTRSEEYRRLPLACLGGPLFVISLFWVGWTARADIHWIVPTLGALPFGMGFLLLFMSLLNYLVDAYEIFAASAMAAASCSRSSFGTILPFAAKPMYNRLGVAWACSTLGFLSLAMCMIPFAFIKYGDRIRANSKFCQYLKQKKQEDEEKMHREAEINREHSVQELSQTPEKQV